MKKCEWCDKEFDDKNGKYRFCSKSCRSKYASSKVKNRVCGYAISSYKRSKKGGWKCVQCNKVFRVKRDLHKHIAETHTQYDENGKRLPWNKGLTKETNESVARGSNTYKERCKKGEIKIWCEGKHLPKEMRDKISQGLKKAHAENRAHNIGQSRWNNEPSWPEQWFMKVIENNFDDQNYIREYSFGRFSLDFAWPHKHKCVEIDGEQHQRFDDVKKRDAAKNDLLAENNWSILRLPWKEVYNNPKTYIDLAKKFIDGE